MTMATISPSGREVSLAGSSCWSSRLVLLKFRLVAAANPRKSSSFIFFLDETLHIAKEGSKWASGLPTSPHGAAWGWPHRAGLWAPPGAPLALLWPGIFDKLGKKYPLIFTAFGVAQNRYLNFAPLSGQNSSCRYSPSSCKPCKIREKRHKNRTVK